MTRPGKIGWKLFALSTAVVLQLCVWTAASAAPTIVVAPGSTPSGYVPLASFGVTASPIGDEQAINFNVPAFRFAGETWTNLGVVSNGYLVVGGSGPATSINNQSFPDVDAPNNVLAPFWTDLNPAAGGEVRIALLTNGPDTWIVVDWNAVRNFSTSTTNSFEVWIGIEGDVNPGEDISFVYGNVGSGDGGLLTVGAEDKTGTVGANYYFNGTGTLPTDGTRLRVTTRDLPVNVPEPATLLLLATGAASLALRRRTNA